MTIDSGDNSTIDRLRGELVRQHDRIRELEEERDKLRADRDRLSAELQRVVVDEHLDTPPFDPAQIAHQEDHHPIEVTG